MSKMEDVARKCKESVLLYFPHAVSVQCGSLENKPRFEEGPWTCKECGTRFGEPEWRGEDHILWMCEQIPKLPRGKADRWLGFVQGWLFETGCASITTMREWNKGIDE
jgi:hypothetical protein